MVPGAETAGTTATTTATAAATAGATPPVISSATPPAAGDFSMNMSGRGNTNMRGYGSGYGAGDGWGRGYNYSAPLLGWLRSGLGWLRLMATARSVRHLWHRLRRLQKPHSNRLTATHGCTTLHRMCTTCSGYHAANAA